eukprot:1192685-Pyramimonas_sp.AAC.1
MADRDSLMMRLTKGEWRHELGEKAENDLSAADAEGNRIRDTKISVFPPTRTLDNEHEHLVEEGVQRCRLDGMTQATTTSSASRGVQKRGYGVSHASARLAARPIRTTLTTSGSKS